MKSLHMIGSPRMGGAERWFVRFINAMLRHGEEVEVAVRRGSELARHHFAGRAHYELPYSTVWDPFSRYAVSRLIARSEAPIVQTYMGRATRLTRIQPGRGKVHVARLGGYYKLDAFRHAHAWIGNTKGLCDWMIRGGLPAKRVFHITNFAEPPRAVAAEALAALRRRIAVRPEDWTILAPGRLIDVKGHRYLIDALRRLPAEINGRRLRLVVLGDGELAGPLKEQARQAGVAERILWAGWQHDPAPWFHMANMVVFPSREAETLGNVILEAWAYGKPLVVTAFRGAREITRPGEDAWVVPCDDGAALAAGMEHVIRNPDLQKHMVTNGLVRIERDFSEAAIIAQYRGLYAKLLDHWI
ncbi:glycosyltransferase [Desulfosoma caldarium]|uniref:Glycosyl transferase family 1 domain-containing protein n=1 Tax=Desulfosoma caldarium TaxID=610254 RepID=A0A3N1UQT2_9BACT|nr:glycosyltransferase [Desulfosoma caldarium]ROQ92098.1 hypothetical protein EDC27_1777 [Desulfosoma caldarium]